MLCPLFFNVSNLQQGPMLYPSSFDVSNALAGFNTCDNGTSGHCKRSILFFLVDVSAVDSILFVLFAAIADESQNMPASLLFMLFTAM